jgi:ABC-type sugar transport system substrate-binding protein
MAATVAQNPNRMGAIAVMWAAQILQGRKPPAEIAVPIKLISKP